MTKQIKKIARKKAQRIHAPEPIPEKAKRIFWITLVGIICVLGIALIWYISQRDYTEKTRFTVLYQDVTHVAAETKDVVDWSDPVKECSHGGAIGLQEGGWNCRSRIEGQIKDTKGSMAAMDILQTKITNDVEFQYKWTDSTRRVFLNKSSNILCNLEYKTDSNVYIIFDCGTGTKKSWYPPTPDSTSESLPGANAWRVYKD